MIMQEKKRFFILDGSSLFYRAFYGIQALLTSPTGEYTNAIYGFSVMLVHLLEEWKPDYLVIAFDKSKNTFRKEMFADYKGTRKPTPPELKSQIPLLHEMADVWGIAFREMEGYEADDIIGTLSKKAVEAGCDAYVVTGDRDALQLIGPQRKVLYTKKGTSDLMVWDESVFADEYGGLSPIQLVDLKGLMGDTSDNIPGVPGVGPKTAIKLIAAYGTVEEVLLHVNELSGKKLKETIADNTEQALLSKKLARICQEVPVEYVPEEFTVKSSQEKLVAFYTKYAMRNMVKQVRSYFKKFPAADMGNANVDLFADAENVTGTEAANTISLFEEAEENSDIGKIVVDEEYALPEFINIRETGSGDKLLSEAKKSKDVCLNFSYMGAVPHLTVSGAAICCGDFYGYVDADSFDWMTVEAILADTKIRKVVYDLKQIYHSNLQMAGEVLDLKLMDYVLNPEYSSHEITELTVRHLDYDVQVERYEEKNKTELKKMSAVEVADWHSERLRWQAYMLKKMYSEMEKQMDERGFSKLYWDIELPLVEVLYSLENNGITVNRQRLAEQREAIGHSTALLEQEIYLTAGRKFNINSPKQLGEVLFDELKLPVQKKTKTGYSTNAEVLEKLADAHPIVEKILNYRTLTKLKSTYLDSLGELIDGETGRIHTSFNQTVTATGRLSSSDPNLQNIPVRTEIGRQIRTVFEPGEGYDYLLSADYSQIELRVLASMSGDEAFITSFKNGEDIHARTAAAVFDVPIDDITPRMRRSAKAVNFGIVYGMSDFGLANDLKISRKEAGAFIEKYFATCPGIKKFLDETVAKAKKNGRVETLYGRRRELPGIKSSNFNQRALAERMAMNTPIQGTAADIIKIAMIRTYKALKEAGLKSRILLQVHDELVLEVVESEVEQIKKLLLENMEGAAELKVPLSIDMNMGKNWAEAK